MERTYILETIRNGLINSTRLSESQMRDIMKNDEKYIEDVNTGLEFDLNFHSTIRRELYGMLCEGKEFFPDIDRPCFIRIFYDGESLVLRIFCGKYDIYSSEIVDFELSDVWLKTKNSYGYIFSFFLLDFNKERG